MNREFLRTYAVKLARENPRQKRVTLAEAEAEVVRVLTEVARQVAPAFRFGSHTLADIQQQAVLEGLLAIENGQYDPARPLANFMYTHFRNRLSNYRRKQDGRAERPCKCGSEDCSVCASWLSRSVAKQNVLRPLPIGNIADAGESSMHVRPSAEREMEYAELIEAIDDAIPAELRSAYLRMRDGLPVSRTQRAKIRELVAEVYNDHSQE